MTYGAGDKRANDINPRYIGSTFQTGQKSMLQWHLIKAQPSESVGTASRRWPVIRVPTKTSHGRETSAGEITRSTPPMKKRRTPTGQPPIGEPETMSRAGESAKRSDPEPHDLLNGIQPTGLSTVTIYFRRLRRRTPVRGSKKPRQLSRK